MTTLAHLDKLVAFDTRNPPRDAEGLRALMSYASTHLESSGFRAVGGGVRDLGDGCLWLHAKRGEGGVLVNIHVDTVPVDPGWTRDPHALLVEHGRAVGLGACDIKGALAAFLTAASSAKGPVELLLTSDEEAGSSRCVRTFCQENDVTGRPMLVAEPTMCRAVTAHRGIATCNGVFTGVGGHASSARALEDSAVHEAVRWAQAAIAYAEKHDVRFNLGLFEGGLKANMIASTAKVRFGARPFAATGDVVAEICGLARDSSRVTWERGYTAPALAPAAGALVAKLGLVQGEPVDFFTEAALFAEAGAVAVVFGPGDIAQAHTAGEHVSLAQLDEATAAYARILT